MTFDQLRREHAQRQTDYVLAAGLLAHTARHVLADAASTLNEVSRRLLVDALARFDKVSDGE